MIKNNLVYKYIKLKSYSHKTRANNAQISNVLNRQFNDKKHNEVVVSDWTYAKVGGK